MRASPGELNCAAGNDRDNCLKRLGKRVLYDIPVPGLRITAVSMGRWYRALKAATARPSNKVASDTASKPAWD